MNKRLHLIAFVFFLQMINLCSAIARNTDSVPFNRRDEYLFKDVLEKPGKEPFPSMRSSDIPFGKYETFFPGLDNEKYYKSRSRDPLEYAFIIGSCMLVIVLVYIAFGDNIKRIFTIKRQTQKEISASTDSLLEQLKNLYKLKAMGAITEEEFNELKGKILGKGS